jgi:xanthine dehydrogenase iron-sulfur cluster and FAD-binding subunit A
MSTILTRPDGLYISTQATWPQMATDETLLQFANGLIPTALNGNQASGTLAEVLYDSGPHINPLLTALLVLDAEVSAVVDDKQPVFPLPGFLTYRSKLPPDKFPLNAIRLPPLNPNGHYILTMANSGFCSAIHLNLNPILKIARRVRIAISSLTCSPMRLQPIEYRLVRQVLNKELIQTVVTAANEDLLKPLTKVEQLSLVEILQRLIDD